MMRYKWGEAESKYFNKKIPIAERVSWFNKLEDWFIWFVVAIMAGATIWILYKLYCLYQIQMWLENL